MEAMQFGGYTWPINPETLQVRQERQVVSYKVPKGGVLLQDMGFAGREVTGEGVLLGERCLAQYQALEQLLRQRPLGRLTLPGRAPFDAMLCSVQLTEEPGPAHLRYRFVFREQPGRHFHPPRTQAAVAQEGESLWEIAARVERTVEQLLRRNPQIRHSGDVEPGQGVLL